MKNAISLYTVLIYFISVGFAQPEQEKVNQLGKDGLRTGLWKKYYKNGKLKYEGSFEHGVPVGIFKRFYDTGGLKAELTYKEGGKAASSKLFHEQNSKLMAEGEYVSEKRNGLWKFYNPYGDLMSEENYKMGVKDGEALEYYWKSEGGKRSQLTTYKNDVKDGPWKQYFVDEKVKNEGTYVKGKLEGEASYYHPNGKLHMKGDFKAGVRVGNWTVYTDNGLDRVTQVYKAGYLDKEIRLNGVFKDYYPNEIVKSEITYKAGKKNGEFTEYYEVGEWVIEEITNKNGQREPVQRFKGQKKRRKGRYVNNKLHGKITSYKEDGSVEKVETYNVGKLVQ